MSAWAEPEEVTEEMVLERVARLRAADPALSAIGAAILVALQLGIVSDTRTFSRVFGIEHALVLREVTELSGERALLAIGARNARTQRTEVALTQSSSALLSRAA